AEFGGCIGIVVDVDLGNDNTALVLPGGFVEQGRDHFAGAAPGRPVVDQYGNVGIDDVGLERGVAHMFDGFAHGKKEKEDDEYMKTIREGRAATQCILCVVRTGLLL